MVIISGVPIFRIFTVILKKKNGTPEINIVIVLKWKFVSPFKTDILFGVFMSTMQTQFRHRRMQCLNWVYIVCL